MKDIEDKMDIAMINKEANEKAALAEKCMTKRTVGEVESREAFINECCV